MTKNESIRNNITNPFKRSRFLEQQKISKKLREEYFARPDIKKKYKEYKKEYNARPGIKDKNKEYMKKYKQKKQ